MRNKKVKLSVFSLLIFGLTGLQAQQAILTAGGNASGSGGSVSYSIGQVFYTTNIGLNYSVAEGVQQTYIITVVKEIEDAKDITLIYSAYPNPVSDYLTFRIDGDVKTQCIAYLFDINGKLLYNKSILANETIIGMNNLAPAIYFLKVTKNNKEIKTFKIIKN